MATCSSPPTRPSPVTPRTPAGNSLLLPPTGDLDSFWEHLQRRSGLLLNWLSASQACDCIPNSFCTFPSHKCHYGHPEPRPSLTRSQEVSSLDRNLSDTVLSTQAISYAANRELVRKRPRVPWVLLGHVPTGGAPHLRTGIIHEE